MKKLLLLLTILLLPLNAEAAYKYLDPSLQEEGLDYYESGSGGELSPWATTSGNVFLDTSTDLVGIGTSTPTERLHIVGTSNTAIGIDRTGGDSLQIGADNTGAYWDVSSGGVYRWYYNNFASEFMRLDSSGRLGINQTSPSEILDIVGNLEVNGTAYFQQNLIGESDQDSMFRFRGGDDVEVMAGGASAIRILEGAEDNLRLWPSGGTVSVGGTSAEATLDVSGDVTVASDLTVTRNAVVYNRLSVNTEQADGNLNVSGSTQLETLDFTTLEGDFSMDSQAVNSIETGINHDNLTGFVAGEHINWTNTTSDFSTTGDAHVGGDLTVNGSIKQGSGAGGTVTLDGSLSISNNLTVDDNVSIYGDLSIGINKPSRGLFHLHEPATSTTAYFHFTNGDSGSTSNDGLSIGVVGSGVAAIVQREAQNLNFSVNGSDRMQIASDGGIFMTSLLAASASTDVNINGSNELHSVTSSLRFKENVKGMSFRNIFKLKPRNFTWKSEGVADHSAGKEDFGLIAEEVYEVMPELVSLDSEGKPYSVKYEMLSVLLLADIKRLWMAVLLLIALNLVVLIKTRK